MRGTRLRIDPRDSLESRERACCVQRAGVGPSARYRGRTSLKTELGGVRPTTTSIPSLGSEREVCGRCASSVVRHAVVVVEDVIWTELETIRHAKDRLYGVARSIAAWTRRQASFEDFEIVFFGIVRESGSNIVRL